MTPILFHPLPCKSLLRFCFRYPLPCKSLLRFCFRHPLPFTSDTLYLLLQTPFSFYFRHPLPFTSDTLYLLLQTTFTFTAETLYLFTLFALMSFTCLASGTIALIRVLPVPVSFIVSSILHFNFGDCFLFFFFLFFFFFLLLYNYIYIYIYYTCVFLLMLSGN